MRLVCAIRFGLGFDMSVHYSTLHEQRLYTHRVYTGSTDALLQRPSYISRRARSRGLVRITNRLAFRTVSRKKSSLQKFKKVHTNGFVAECEVAYGFHSMESSRSAPLESFCSCTHGVSLIHGHMRTLSSRETRTVRVCRSVQARVQGDQSTDRPGYRSTRVQTDRAYGSDRVWYAAWYPHGGFNKQRLINSSAL